MRSHIHFIEKYRHSGRVRSGTQRPTWRDWRSTAPSSSCTPRTWGGGPLWGTRGGGPMTHCGVSNPRGSRCWDLRRDDLTVVTSLMVPQMGDGMGICHCISPMDTPSWLLVDVSSPIRRCPLFTPLSAQILDHICTLLENIPQNPKFILPQCTHTTSTPSLYFIRGANLM